MKKYRITFSYGMEKHFINVEFSSRKKAWEFLMEYIKNHNEDLDDDDDYLTPFDFSLEECEAPEVNEIITDFETARKRLGVMPNMDFIVNKKLLSRNSLRIEDVTRLVQSLNPSHIEALIALNELFTIAEAWNEEDGFVPDFSNRNQCKYFPWFTYNRYAAGFVYAGTHYVAASANAYIGSRLCFKTKSRAEQFGKQFAHLYNKVFLLNK